MGETPWTSLIGQLHASDYQMVLAVTGGGSKAISQLLDQAGASRTLLEAVIPYSHSSLAEWLGGPPEKSCSEATARAMSMSAWLRARHLAADTDPRRLIGVGATASLASDLPKRGAHRVHVAVQTTAQTATCSLQLSKGCRDRKKEQWLAAKWILLAIGRACQIDDSIAGESFDAQLFEEDELQFHVQPAAPEWADLLIGNLRCFAASGRLSQDAPRIVFPGAFNPPHAGHRRMAEIAAAKIGQPVTFELSITNVDKLPLDYISMHQRIEGFQGWDNQAELILTDAPTFQAKSILFPGCTFVVGADTIVRIADPTYYAGNVAARDAAIRTIADLKCRFLVFGRHQQDKFLTLAEMQLPGSLQALCEQVSQSEFCSEISSTSLRQRRGRHEN